MSQGLIIWLTGLSGAGKSTIAERLREELVARGRSVEVLDGDEVRTHLSKGLGFSREDRDTNVRRIGYVARVVARQGGVAITAAISPYREVRDEVREQSKGAFVEVYVKCSLDELVRRDVKGLYKKALAGEIQNFTGVNDPYEPPLNAEVVVDTEQETVDESVTRILEKLLPAWRGGPSRSEGEGDVAGLPRLDVSSRDVADAYMLATGALWPLTGFIGKQDHQAILETGRLAAGDPFTIPVTLRVDAAHAARLRGATQVALWHEGRAAAVVDVEDIYQAPRQPEAQAVFGTEDPAHPGVAHLLAAGEYAIAGAVTLLGRPPSPFPGYDLTPAEVRAARDRQGWRTMVGFQTRNPVHRAHEYLQKVALESIDGLLLHPLVGETKAGDIPADVRMRCYQALLDGYYPADRVLLATNPAWMRYAGPKEAVFHAIVRRNYGCTHFIVGRDHAGVGSYYDTYAAHRIFDEYTPQELGITILRFDNTFYCTACGSMASTRTCPHPPEEHLTLSGTRVRELLAAGHDLPVEFSRPEVAEVLREAYAEPSDEASA
jgi:sulfate adenylyltransferase/3'-phosphoadenosine 5'-phosphosulfate synthase